MSVCPPENSRCADLVIVLPLAGQVHVYAYACALRQQTLLWHEVAAQHAGSLGAALAPLLAAHPLRLETAAVLFAEPQAGGFLLPAANADSHRDAAWMARQLQQALPYAAADLLWRSRAGSGQVELFWLPRAWVSTQVDALARVGLRLTEIFPRAALLRQEAHAQGVDVLQETDALHVFEAALLRRSAALPALAEDAERARSLEALALGADSAVPRHVALAADPNLSVRLLSLWRDGAEAIFLASAAAGRWQRWPAAAPWAPLLDVAVACLMLLLVVAGMVQWQNDGLEDDMAQMERRYRKLAPAERKYVEVDTALRRERKLSAAARALDASTTPYETLNAVSQALPQKYWIQRLQYKERALELSGRGGSNADVVAALGDKGVVAQAVGGVAADGKDSFTLRLDLSAAGAAR